MAQLFSLAVAGLNEAPLASVTNYAVPTTGILVETISQTIGGVACVSKVTISPNLPSPMQIRLYSATSVTNIITAANATTAPV
jgi:hypothetical protein